VKGRPFRRELIMRVRNCARERGNGAIFMSRVRPYFDYIFVMKISP